MNTSQQIERVRVLLDEALVGVRNELAKCQQGQIALDSEQNLRWIASSLERMLASLDQPQRPEIPGIWRVVTDTWPYNLPLRAKVIEAEYAYQRLSK